MSTTQTSIAWTDRTWNPVRGCSRVSPGCQNCYAERMASRFAKAGWSKGFAEATSSGPRWTGRVELVPGALTDPLSWRKPQKIFVNSMSDLFHEALPDDAIDRVFAVMADAHRHTFQILTKRADRMRDYFRDETKRRMRVAAWLKGNHKRRADDTGAYLQPWPLPNVWLGVSVEDQQRADERIPSLLGTPAAVRFLSVEPMLGPVDLGLNSATCGCCPRRASRWVRLTERVWAEPYMRPGWASPGIYRAESNQHGALCVRDSSGELLGIKPAEFEALPGLDWVIVGGESGPGARPCDLAWIRSIVEQCAAAAVPAFVKQMGSAWVSELRTAAGAMRAPAMAPKDPKGGDPSEWPSDLSVRQFPEVPVA